MFLLEISSLYNILDFIFVRNKVKIVTDGAMPPLVELLKMQNSSIRELATAAILTLSAATSHILDGEMKLLYPFF